VQQGFIISSAYVMYSFSLIIEQHNVELVCTESSAVEINYGTAFCIF
jgi:hypothetical protein